MGWAVGAGGREVSRQGAGASHPASEDSREARDSWAEAHSYSRVFPPCPPLYRYITWDISFTWSISEK